LSAAVALLAFAAPAQALPPVVTLTASAGNPPVFTGTAGTTEWESGEIAVEVFAGDAASGAPVQVATAVVDRKSGAFSGTLGAALDDGTYTARARQRNMEQETGYSAPLVFTIGEVASETAPTPSHESVVAAADAKRALAVRVQEPAQLHQARAAAGRDRRARRRHGQWAAAEERHHP
jgi:hypothetical protein